MAKSRENGTTTLLGLEGYKVANILIRRREPILKHFYDGITSGFTEGRNTTIKMLKRVSCGLTNVGGPLDRDAPGLRAISWRFPRSLT